MVSKIKNLFNSFASPKVWMHSFRMLHYYGYSHVIPRGKMSVGSGTGVSPNASFRNGERIVIGNECHIGERVSLWAGDSTGKITLGNFISIAPDVFITASDYQFEKGKPFRSQVKKERDVVIGDDVWLGAKVVITAGITIGEGCIIGAGAVVTKDLPANSIAVGVPAKVVGMRE